MSTSERNPFFPGRLGALLAAGALAMALSGTASARGGHDDDYRGHGARHGQHYDHGHHGKRWKKHRRRHRRHHGHHRHHDRPRTKVVHVYHHEPAPVVERHVVVKHRDYDSGYNQVSPRAAPYSGYRGPQNLNAGSLIGAAVGGLLGSQIGGGSGKLAATAAGTVGGFLLGDHASRGYR